MPRPRRTQISLEDTPYYHCCSRVVRRAFLCGDDTYSGKNYDHRRGWVESLLFELEAVFAIDVAAFAVMSNHLHVVLRVDIDSANRWTDREVLEQWHKLFKGDDLTQKFAKGELVEAHEVNRLRHSIAIYRSRLCDISWFMRCLHEPIARQANQEDNCTGRFWEGRFKAQALLDEAAVLTCMAYVDLNPIRAQIADTPEQSDHTSIQLRIRAALKGEQPKNLLPFIGNDRENQPKGIAFSLTDYLEIVRHTHNYFILSKGKGMYWYLTILSYSLFVLAIALLFYRLHLLFTGSRVSGVVTNFITRNRSLTGTAKSTLIEISYKNSSGVDCKFEADNGLLVYIYKIGDSVSLSERNGKIIVNSLFNILTAPIFLFTMSYVIFNFLA